LSEPKLISGKIAIISILVVAVGLTSFAWWYRYQQGRRTMEFWGPEAAQLIRHAPRVELFELDETLEAFKSGELSKVRSFDLSNAPGLVHARHSLIVDRNFRWDESSANTAANIAWDVAWRFIDGDKQTTVLLDYETGAVRDAAGERVALLHPAIAGGMRDYISRHTAER